MALTQAQFKKALNALLAAYPDRDDLKITLAMTAGRVYADLTAQATRKAEYFNIISKARAQGWAEELIVAAHEEFPDNGDLSALANELSIAAPPVVAEPPALISPAEEADADSADAEAQRALQRLVTAGDPSVNAEQLLHRLAVLGSRTGAVEIGGMHQGTCFLVGPDVILTNHHVIKPLLTLGGDDVTVRFDRYVDEHDVVQTGWTVPLHDDWHMHSRPHGPADESNNPDDIPDPDQLDFALVHLSEKAADRPRPGQTEPRGWCALNAPLPEGPVGNHVTLIQHPAGAPRQMSFGHILSYGGAKLRMRYSANTKSGSSGSPVANSKGQLIALHHAGDPNFAQMAKYNQGIPIKLIQDDITAAGLMGALTV
ncbi:trypsin-like peptidase domain-containing protein [Arenibacterium sp. CAU 1754]